MKKILTIDYSTQSTGYAVLDLETKQILDFGVIQPDKKLTKGKEYPSKQLAIMQSMAQKINALIESITDLYLIYIEEVNRGISRIGQKVLCGGHFILLHYLNPDNLRKVRFKSSDGPEGWRTRLNLRLGENDKKLNVERRRINKHKIRGTADLPIITKKHLAARFVNDALNMSWDVDRDPSANDIVDALGLMLAVVAEIE